MDRRRLDTTTATDASRLREINGEKAHRRDAVQFLYERNLDFRETNNGNFLGLIEMLVKFDPTMQERVRRVKNKDTRATKSK